MSRIETISAELGKLNAIVDAATASGAGDGLQPIGPLGSADDYLARICALENELTTCRPSTDVEARILARFLAERSEIVAADFAEPAGIGPVVADLATAARNLAAYLGATVAAR